MRGRFVRGGEVTSYEIRRDRPIDPYSVHITHPNGSVTVEVIAHASELIAHVAELMKRLVREGWTLEAP